FVRVYINNIIIFSKTEEEYLKHLYTVYEILDKAHIYIGVAKSFAGYLAIRLLRYIINGEGITKTDDRIATFKKLKFPDTLDSLEHYLGMAKWLRKGILWFDAKARPL
ncbi:hypothetical protein MYCTH_2050269, partial [Thermothelomyces thermophilus ATCC 42464]